MQEPKKWNTLQNRYFNIHLHLALP